MRSTLVTSLASGVLAWYFAIPVQVAQALTFDPGTYFLAQSFLGAPVDTLKVSVSGGVASFDLTGADNETFSIPSPSKPTGHVMKNKDPYYLAAPPVTASWNSTLFPYITFYKAIDEGGLSVGSKPGDKTGNLLLNLFQSTEGPGQVFNRNLPATPLPSTWLMLLAGLVGLGFVAHRGSKAAATTTAAA
jgi:hypothetical protein